MGERFTRGRHTTSIPLSLCSNPGPPLANTMAKKKSKTRKLPVQQLLILSICRFAEPTGRFWPGIEEPADH